MPPTSYAYTLGHTAARSGRAKEARTGILSGLASMFRGVGNIGVGAAQAGVGLARGTGKALSWGPGLAAVPLYAGYRGYQGLTRPEHALDTPDWGAADSTRLQNFLQPNQDVVRTASAPLRSAITSALIRGDWATAQKLQGDLAAGRVQQNPARGGFLGTSLGAKPETWEAPSDGNMWRSIGHKLFPNLVDRPQPTYSQARSALSQAQGQLRNRFQIAGQAHAGAPQMLQTQLNQLQAELPYATGPDRQMIEQQIAALRQAQTSARNSLLSDEQKMINDILGRYGMQTMTTPTVTTPQATTPTPGPTGPTMQGAQYGWGGTAGTLPFVPPRAY